jgi:hypothetical protein
MPVTLNDVRCWGQSGHQTNVRTRCYTTTNAPTNFNQFYNDLRWRPSSPAGRTKSQKLRLCAQHASCCAPATVYRKSTLPHLTGGIQARWIARFLSRRKHQIPIQRNRGAASLSPPRYDEVKNQSSEHNCADRRHHFHGASPELGHAWFNTADCGGLE